jgi:hypothetical protein
MASAVGVLGELVGSIASGKDLPRTRRAYRGTILAQSSCTLMRRLFAGRTIFLGPETEQSLIQLLIFHLPHVQGP